MVEPTEFNIQDNKRPIKKSRSTVKEARISIQMDEAKYNKEDEDLLKSNAYLAKRLEKIERNRKFCEVWD